MKTYTPAVCTDTLIMISWGRYLAGTEKNHTEYLRRQLIDLSYDSIICF